jgi:hypothetical protein
LARTLVCKHGTQSAFILASRGCNGGCQELRTMKTNDRRPRPAPRSYSRMLRDLSVAPDGVRRVIGGKLLEAAVKGKVFKKVEIHGTA